MGPGHLLGSHQHLMGVLGLSHCTETMSQHGCLFLVSGSDGITRRHSSWCHSRGEEACCSDQAWAGCAHWRRELVWVRMGLNGSEEATETSPTMASI